MPRPTTKTELLARSQENFDKLFAFIDALPADAQENDYPLNERDKNLRDIVCHLYEWHCMMERWYTDGIRGKDPAVPAEGYTWKTMTEMNRVIWKNYQTTQLAEAKKLLKKAMMP